MAAVAVPREFDSLGSGQYIHARSIKRRPERVRMQRLPPFTVGLRMAVSAITSVWKCARLNKAAGLAYSIAGSRDIPVPKAERVVFAYVAVVGV